jgi:hypothetical protein
VVVRVAADLLEVVVLAADAETLLRVDRALYGRVSLPRKTCLNGTMPALVKSRLGSFSGTSGRARHDRVAARAEEIEETLADLVSRHGILVAAPSRSGNRPSPRGHLDRLFDR